MSLSTYTPDFPKQLWIWVTRVNGYNAIFDIE